MIVRGRSARGTSRVMSSVLSRIVLAAWVVVPALLFTSCGAHSPRSGDDSGENPYRAARGEPVVVTLASPSPLITIRVLVRAGSTHDPVGKEGLAELTANALIEGGFGDASAPVTKEALSEMVLPWGGGAMPSAQVGPETTTFHFTVPQDVLDEYVDRIAGPLFSESLLLDGEIERLKTELAADVSSARLESLEGLGLAAIDGFVHEGTRYVHRGFGSETSLPTLNRDDVVGFLEEHYRPGNVILGVSTDDRETVGRLEGVVAGLPGRPGPPAGVPPKPPAIEGRRAVVVEEPNAPAAGVHIGFPIDVNRSHPDYWPLYVANVWLGTHRDSFGRLYRAIRQERGYNYGDYSYIEHWDGRPWSLFQVFNQPRRHQYFSIWIRPVAYDHAHHIAKAATWELARLVREGLSDEQVAAAKNKASVLYLNLAETVGRLLSARVDDAYYGQSPGFLEGYLDAIERVTPERVNAAIRRHLQTDDLRYVLVTNSSHADALVEALGSDDPAYGKDLGAYEIERADLGDGRSGWTVPDDKVEMLQLDAVWAHYPLSLDDVRKLSVESLFRTGQFDGT